MIRVLENFPKCIQSTNILLNVYHVLNSEFGTGIIMDYKNMTHGLWKLSLEQP